jgi:hydrogenase expression/formation protein HypE
MGKLSDKELRKLLGCIKKDTRVIVPPNVGYDSGVHLMGDKYLVVSTDPCTGVPEKWFGWLLINYAASDVALFGAKPEFCTINLLGSLWTTPKAFQDAMKQACSAAAELGIAIVTGHTGTYDSLTDLVGVCTVYGTIEPERLITPGNAKSGDLILCTKPLGLETAVNFSLKHEALAQKLFGLEQTEKLGEEIPMQSCVKEALQLAELRGVHAMHDITEGGLMMALNEMAEASKVGLILEFDKLKISPEVQVLQKTFGLSDEQVLAMSSTGSVLAAVDPKDKEEVEELLNKIGLQTSFIGTFKSDNRRVQIKKGMETLFPKKADDPYARILSGNLNFEQSKSIS